MKNRRAEIALVSSLATAVIAIILVLLFILIFK